MLKGMGKFAHVPDRLVGVISYCRKECFRQYQKKSLRNVYLAEYRGGKQ